jgi:hypothetical protein
VHIRRGTTLALAVLAAGLLTAGLPGPAQAAAAPTATPLSLPAVSDVVSAGDRVFVSGGPSSTDVVVASATGAVVGTLSGLPGPSDLLLSGDRQTLYVALPSASAIAAFDTGSLVELARYDTGAGECPSSLALTGRYLWFGYGCGGWDGNIGRIDLGRQPARVTTGLDTGGGFYGAPLLTAASQNRSVLLAGQPGLSPASVSARWPGRRTGPGSTRSPTTGSAPTRSRCTSCPSRPPESPSPALSRSAGVGPNGPAPARSTGSVPGRRDGALASPE